MTDRALFLAQQLIQSPSITPLEAGILSFLEEHLRALGFECYRLPFSEEGTEAVDNLFAIYQNGSPHFCFAGHTDVVPAGRREKWIVDPFEASVKDGILYGRGASDMKGAIACFIDALDEFLKFRSLPGTISLLFTGDEEGPAINGTKKVLEWMREQNFLPDFCLVGEPTSDKLIGDTIKIGRRGSFTGHLIVEGKTGHVAYPAYADNAITKLIDYLTVLKSLSLDQEDEHFQPSHLEITQVSSDNRANNVIPGLAEAWFNIRFNTLYSHTSLEQLLRAALDKVNPHDYKLQSFFNSVPFLSPITFYTTVVERSIEEVCGVKPCLSTSGGTSDARFIHRYCPVIELGALNRTAHQENECIEIADLVKLRKIYFKILQSFFSSSS